MKTLNKNTKKAQQYINAYNHSTLHYLEDCYKSYSNDKRIAYNKCNQEFLKVYRAHVWEHPYSMGVRILSFNTFGFTCAWHTEEGLRVETPANSYLIPDVTD